MPLPRFRIGKVTVLVFLVTLSPWHLATLSFGQEADMVQSLPHPPAWPRSLYAPPTPLATSEPMVPVEPYFLKDPLLDRPDLPPPGWFGLAWADVVHPRLVNHLRAEFTYLNGNPQLAQTAAAPLDWTVSPALALGYRFPAGFGDVYFLWRGLASSGSGLVNGYQNHSRIDFNVAEFNYANSELWPCPGWIFRPEFGLRLAYDYLDSVAEASNLPVGRPAYLRTTNSNRGIGPHAGLRIGRYLSGTSLAVTAQVDVATLIGYTSQGIIQQTVLDPAGGRLGQSFFNGYAGWNPQFNGQAGLLWAPAACRGFDLFVGYTYQAWWSIGEIGLSNAAFLIQGIALRATFQF